MKRRFLAWVLGIFMMGFGSSHAAEMVNVEYIHNAIKQKWDITVPYNLALRDPRVAANMKYLLTAVDVANEMLNGEKTTNYGDGAYATLAAADTVATLAAVDTLIQEKPFDPKFFITTIANTKTFSFKMSATGNFIVDWGDGNQEKIVRTNSINNTYSHTYDTAGTYIIALDGHATGYPLSPSYAAIAFSDNKLANISGSLGAIFPTIGDGRDNKTQPSFKETFYYNNKLTGTIPENLFDGVHGQPIKSMFESTFWGCSKLTGSIPENLFSGISGHPTENLFYSTFMGCTSLDGEIPENLFAGIVGAPAKAMFYATFGRCTKLSGEIPANLFAGISGAPAENMFDSTFGNCPGLTGSIPENLFAGIRGAPAYGMFSNTFGDSKGLSSIPANLFAGISGTPAISMFQNTFFRCSGLRGEIPSNLFSGISGTPKADMFNSTFSGCSGLTGRIPDNLFAGISGAPANAMFYGTFSGCAGLTSIGDGLFGDLSGNAQQGMFANTFSGCSGLTGPSARTTSGQYLYKIWPDVTAEQAGDCYTGATGLSDYANIPYPWRPADPFDPKFVITTTPITSSFSFKMSAAGDFTVDWGDGNKEKIARTDTTETTYSHTYSAAGEYRISMDGKATGYSTSNSVAAISFQNNTNLAKIDGSLGQIFSTIGNGRENGQQPRFNYTFSRCSGLTGEIPGSLFSGINGAPVNNMFLGTFDSCLKLTGEIPSGLFAGISGAPAEYMFSGTFNSCSGLTGEIPAELFAGINGAPAEYMFHYTFNGCIGLTGEIPSGLFAGISGAPAVRMFNSTFYGCSGLTSIGDGVFGDLSGNAQPSMFMQTFFRCNALTGPSARTTSGKYLYEIWPSANSSQVGGCYRYATSLSDYADMPSAWK